MAITIPQSTVNNTTANSNNKAFGSNNAGGNLGVAFVFYANTATLNSFSDSTGNTWTFFTSGNDTVIGGITACYYCLSLKPGSAANITVSYSASIYNTLWLIEAAAGSGFTWSTDGNAYAFGTGTAVSSGNLTTLGNNDLLLAALEASASVFTPTGGFTLLNTDPGNSIGISMWNTKGAPGSYAATATLGASTNWDALEVAFFAKQITGGVGGSLIGAYDFWGGGFS